MPEIVLLYTPLDDEAAAREMARQLLAERLCACVNLLPTARSWYYWEGALEEATESILLLKTSATHADALQARVQQLHPYKCPCILRATAEVNSEYADWVSRQTGPAVG